MASASFMGGEDYPPINKNKGRSESARKIIQNILEMIWPVQYEGCTPHTAIE